MLDLLFIVEIAWCTILIAIQGVKRALLYSGGVLASGFAGSQLSGWFAKVLLPPASHSFLWLQSQLSVDTKSVLILSGFIPAEPVLSGLPQNTWITIHIVQTMFFIGITLAVLTLFVVVAYLSNALYDRPQPYKRKMEALLFTPLLALSTGIYAAIITGVLVGNLAWLHEFVVLRTPVAHSVGMHWIAHILSTRTPN